MEEEECSSHLLLYAIPLLLLRFKKLHGMTEAAGGMLMGGVGKHLARPPGIERFQLSFASAISKAWGRENK